MSTNITSAPLSSAGRSPVENEIEKATHNELEHGQGDYNKPAGNSHVLKSHYDRLTYWQTVWRFKKASAVWSWISLSERPFTEFGPWLTQQAVLICTAMCVSAGADGYQISLNG
jgi:hypothetical protein